MYLLETAHCRSAREGWRRRACEAASLGKMPTTLVRRLTSAWSFDRVARCKLLAHPWGSHVGEDVVLGFVHQGGELGDLGPDGRRPGATGPSRCRRPPGRRRWREGGDDAPTLAAGMGQQVAGGARGIFARWRRGSGERPSGPCGRRRSPASRRAARASEGAQELGPEGLGLRRADRSCPDHVPPLTATATVTARDDASGLAHLHRISRPSSGEEAVDDLAASLETSPPDIPIA